MDTEVLELVGGVGEGLGTQSRALVGLDDLRGCTLEWITGEERRRGGGKRLPDTTGLSSPLGAGCCLMSEHPPSLPGGELVKDTQRHAAADLKSVARMAVR